MAARIETRSASPSDPCKFSAAMTKLRRNGNEIEETKADEKKLVSVQMPCVAAGMCQSLDFDHKIYRNSPFPYVNAGGGHVFCKFCNLPEILQLPPNSADWSHAGQILR